MDGVMADDRGSTPRERKMFLFSTPIRPALEPTSPVIKWAQKVKWPEQ
jgi:hypothetical protein